MTSSKKIIALNILALLCAIWFALTSWFWAYLANVFLSFPFGLLGLLFWYLTRRTEPHNKVNKAVLGLLIAGVVSAVITFFIFQ